MAFAVRDLPEPDSPTMATVSPRPTSRSVPTVMARPAAEIDRPRTASNASPLIWPRSFRQSLEQPVADQVHADGGENDHAGGQQQAERVAEEDVAILEQHPAPIRRARLDPEAEEGEAGEIHQREGEIQHDI